MAGPWLQLDAIRGHLPVRFALAGRRAQHLLREAHLPHAGRTPHLRCQDPAHGTDGSALCQVIIVKSK